MIYNETRFKLIASTSRNPERRIRINNDFYHVIDENEFSPDEIEELRDLEKWRIENGNPPTIANFLPDDIRPPHVKKL